MNVPDLGRLVDEYDGEPAALRWLLIHPDGRLVERTTENSIAWWPEHNLWVQWRLLRDVYREVAPTNHGFDLAGAVAINTSLGTVIMARLDTEPVNAVATGMLGDLRIERQVHGPLAWLGDAHPDTGLLGNLDDEKLAGLMALAAPYGATPGGAS